MQRKHFLIAVAVLIITAWQSVGYHQGDEHFQILEFAAYKLGVSTEADLAWEYGEQMRPAFQPALAYGAYQLFGGPGTTHPYWLAFLLRLCSGALFLYVAYLMFQRYADFFQSTKSRQYFVWLLLFHWCAVYSGIRFSGENWSGLMVALAFLWYPVNGLISGGKSPLTEKTHSWWKYLGLGFLFGIGFLFRYQIAIMIVGFLGWLLVVGREKWSNLLGIVLGGLLAVGMGIVLDYWMYGEWVLTSWNYLAVNLIEGKAATFGTAPWWAYFKIVFERGVPPLSIVYILGTLAYCYYFRKDPITWMVIPFLVVHSLLSRKDVRFLFPLLPLLPLLMLAPVEFLTKNKPQFWENAWTKRLVGLFWFINFGLLASVAVRPATTEVLVSRFVYNHYPEPTTLFSYTGNITPFNRFGLETKFYERVGKLTMMEIEEGSPPACITTNCLFVVHSSAPNPPSGSKLVYSNLPEWAKVFNFGGWQDRMSWWYIYEL